MLLDHSAGSPAAVLRGAGPSRCPKGGLSQREALETCTAGECLKTFHAVIRTGGATQRRKLGQQPCMGLPSRRPRRQWQPRLHRHAHENQSLYSQPPTGCRALERAGACHPPSLRCVAAADRHIKGAVEGP